MNTKKRNALLFSILVAGLCASGFAIAKWVGQYYCGPSCTFDTPLLSGDGYMFIRSDVNPDVNSWMDSNNNPNTVTLCNGSTCALYRYVALSGQWLLISKYFSTWSGTPIRPDENGGAGGGGMCGGAPFGNTQMGWGVTGYKPVYRTASVSTPSGTSSQQVLVGYEPTYGMMPANDSIEVC